MSVFLHIGQDYAEQLKAHSTITSGNPGISGDGINWPYDPKGNTPDPSQFNINWNDPNALQQAEQAYERLINWLKQNPGCYNGYIMLLQMTTDIGINMARLPASQQQELSRFLSKEITSPNNLGGNLLRFIISLAAQGAAVQQGSEADGEKAAHDLLEQIKNATSGSQRFGYPFSDIFAAASSTEGAMPGWCQSHYKTFVDQQTQASSSTWIDDNGLPISSFSNFANMGAFQLGMFLNNSDVNDVINNYYQSELLQLVAQFKNNPWALMAALMNLINQRDQDDGMAINGYGGNLSKIKDANALIQKLLGDISGPIPNAADFFKTMGELRALVEQDPALSGLVSQLQTDIDTINGQKYTGYAFNYTVSAGYYNFPPGTDIMYNGKEIQVSGEVYLSGGTIGIPNETIEKQGFTFGQLAAMGATSAIQTEMGSWASTVMSSFENNVTGIQSLLNGASPAIQQQIQSATQTMQARENFEKEIFSSLTSVNQQIMALIKQAMG